jgi:hypothetical protein
LADEAIVDMVAEEVLARGVVERAVRLALDELAAQPTIRPQDGVQVALASVDAEIARLTAAIAAGGPLSSLVAAVQTREQERERLSRELRRLSTTAPLLTGNRAAIERLVRAKVADLRALLRNHLAEARLVLHQLLTDRLVFTPFVDGTGARKVRIDGRFALDRIFSLVLGHNVSMPGSA